LKKYPKNIQKHPPLQPPFQPLQLNQPTIEHTIQILKPLPHPYQPHHPINISHEPFLSAPKFTHRYLSHPFLPHIPIHLI
ncbi:hypothetical protein, partial [Staphylococcus saprophyticus]|uniref:hypothetical protein n=1 Tax=Staphylococcus saprophyticus TaxID=29385 RepID=UPI0016432D9C